MSDETAKLQDRINKLEAELAERTRRSDIWMRSDLQAREYAVTLERQLEASKGGNVDLIAVLERVGEIAAAVRRCKQVDRDWLLDVLEAPIFTRFLEPSPTTSALVGVDSK